MRLDQYIKDKLSISRNKAQAIIKSWNVIVDNINITKTWFEVDVDNIIKINQLEETQYVARSAIKLKYFLNNNKLDLNNKIALDIWSSTWGFCQILLENNISKIYEVDVWNNQLHEKLRNNNKITIKENTDIRKLWKLDQDIDIITCDVSFISLNLIIDSILSYMNQSTIAIILFKPQFEVWSKFINKKWVVINQKIIDDKLNEFLQKCRDSWTNILKVEKSKLEWENWNKEIFIELQKK